GTRAAVAAELVVAAELAEEALERVVVGEVVEAGHVEAEGEAAVAVAGGIDLGLDADADDGGRDLLDDIGKAGRLHAFDTHRFGKHRGGSGRDRAEPDRAGDGERRGR